MADVTFERDEQVREIAKELIRTVDRHAHLRAAQIAYLRRDEETEEGISKYWSNPKGGYKLGQMRRPGAQDRYLGSIDLVLTVCGKAWDGADEAGRIALVDHELSHAVRSERGWKIIGHDVEEFSGVVRRRGLWRGDLIALLQAAEEHGYDKQMTLPMRGEDEGDDGTRCFLSDSQGRVVELHPGGTVTKVDAKTGEVLSGPPPQPAA